MSLFDDVATYCGNEDKGERAIFEAALTQKIQTKGYKLSDLMYEVYLCQKAIGFLQTRADVADEQLLKIEIAPFKSNKKGK